MESEDGNNLESESNHRSDGSDLQSNANPDKENFKQEDKPMYYGQHKEAYLLGDTYMKKLTKDVSLVE